jgi:hypothetical protein
VHTRASRSAKARSSSAAVPVFGVSLLVVLDATSPGALNACAVCIGFGAGLICVMTVLSKYFGSIAYASALGIALAVQTAAGAVASLVAGDIYARFGSHRIAFVGTAILFLRAHSSCYSSARRRGRNPLKLMTICRPTPDCRRPDA